MLEDTCKHGWNETRHPVSGKLMLWCPRCQAWLSLEDFVARFRELERASDELEPSMDAPI